MFRMVALRVALAAFALAALMGAVDAQGPESDDAPPPTPRLEPADGTVLLSSDFREATSLAGWSPDRDGIWSLARGALRGKLPDRKQARSINDNGIWHHLRVEALEGRYRVLVDGRLVLERTDPNRLSRQGRIGLAAYTGGIGHCTVYDSNVS